MKIKRWDSDTSSSKFLFKRRFGRKRSTTRTAAWALLVLVIFSGAGIGVWWGANHPYFRVKNVTITGLRSIAESEVRANIQEYLSGYLGYSIPRDDIFLISRDGFAASLREKFPKIKEVRIEKNIPDTLVVTIHERDLWGLACPSGESDVHVPIEEGEEPVSATGEIIFDDVHESGEKTSTSRATAKNCLLIDEEGFAFDALEGLGVGALPTIYIQDGSGGAGGAVVEKTHIDYFRAVEESAGALGIDLVGLRMDDVNPKDYTLLFAGDWQILVPRATDPAAWISQVQTLFETTLKDHVPDIEHIDLRFGNKVFYKFKQ